MVNVNIAIDDGLHKKMKLYCVKHDVSIKDYVNQAIGEELRNAKK